MLRSLVVVAICLTAVASGHTSTGNTTAPSNTYLMRLQCCGTIAPGGKCTKAKHDLHGLWPNWAQSCTGPAFSEALIKDLIPQMNLYWPSCVGGNGNIAFWTHEWTKHGTCSGMKQHTYFETALRLRSQHASNISNDFCFARADFALLPLDNCGKP
eukprot:m.411650 g.411650  ORF g.411650 m.411650 type:complete len:156 (-) comp28710_c0_seq1:255-722(-)